MKARAVLDCLGFDLLGRGEIAVRLAKATFKADGTVLDRGKPHRFVLKPGDDISAAIDIIGNHLETMGYERLSDRDVARLKAHAMIEWTPEIIEEHLQRWVEWERENEAHCRSKGVPALTLNTARTVDFIERLQLAQMEEVLH